MYPVISLFNKSIPSYWLCSLLGIIVCIIVSLRRKKYFKDLEQVDITNSAALVCIGAIIGARLLYLVTISPILIKNIDVLLSNKSLAYEVLSNGMVFYGGLFGALFTLYAYVRHYNLDSKAFFDFYAPLFPLFHSFGRIGCFLTGCCYGIESHRFGMEYHNSIIAPNDIELLPIQLLCSALNIVLFFGVLIYEKRHHIQGKGIWVYLVVYSVGRFFVEFLRGDELRGIILGLSTSQWISIMLLLVVLFRIKNNVWWKKTENELQ